MDINDTGISSTRSNFILSAQFIPLIADYISYNRKKSISGQYPSTRSGIIL
jgi:hypothetical protein